MFTIILYTIGYIFIGFIVNVYYKLSLNDEYCCYGNESLSILKSIFWPITIMFYIVLFPFELLNKLSSFTVSKYLLYKEKKNKKPILVERMYRESAAEQ